MNNQESLLDLWNFMKFSEKQKLMQQYRKVYGNHYSKVDFISFLADHYKGMKLAKSIDGKTIDGK